MKECFEIAPRNVNHVRVRPTVEKYRGQMGSDTVPRDPAGSIINDPSDDELPPIVHEEILLAQESSPALDLTLYTSPNLNTPSKRPAPYSSDVAPDPEAPRAVSTLFSKDDQDFANHHAMTTPCISHHGARGTAAAGRKRTIPRLAGLLCPLSGGQSDGGDP